MEAAITAEPTSMPTIKDHRHAEPSVRFAPTAIAVQNLENEGIPAERIIRTGDVMHDAALANFGLYFGMIAPTADDLVRVLIEKEAVRQ